MEIITGVELGRRWTLRSVVGDLYVFRGERGDLLKILPDHALPSVTKRLLAEQEFCVAS
jgi:hypothetical protein